MPESQFMQEVSHRTALLTGSLNPGRAINWVQKAGNRQRLFLLQEEARKYLSGVTRLRQKWRRSGTGWKPLRIYRHLSVSGLRRPGVVPAGQKGGYLQYPGTPWGGASLYSALSASRHNGNINRRNTITMPCYFRRYSFLFCAVHYFYSFLF